MTAGLENRNRHSPDGLDVAPQLPGDVLVLATIRCCEHDARAQHSR